MVIEKVKQYIDKHQLFIPQDKLIVGVSGGADSVALLDILCHLGYECIVAHCNFHLRGDESDRDKNHVEQISKSYSYEFVVVDFDTELYACKNSISIEMAARELRYDWFENLRIAYKAGKIVVGHHRDDSVETVLLNLIRGTGIRGVKGIASCNGYIARPLLDISRSEIMTYIETNKLSYVDDSTNNESIYVRNKIRLEVLPLLESINPSVKDAIAKTSQHLLQVYNIYQDYIQLARKEILMDNKIDIAKLKQYTEPKAILFEILSEYNFNSATVDNIFDILDAESGKLFYSVSHRILKDRDYLFLDSINSSDNNDVVEIHEGVASLSYPFSIRIEQISNSPILKIEKDVNTLYLDAQKIKYPLMIRRWQQGDWFIPFGMKGRKKLSDYFSDNKMSIFEKEKSRVLVSANGDIMWLIGHRSDERYRITKETKGIIKIGVSPAFPQTIL